MNRTELGWALLLSVPVGVGVTTATVMTTGGDYPLAFGFGGVIAVGIFLVVALGVSDVGDVDADVETE